jgi:hypothetical protein
VRDQSEHHLDAAATVTAGRLCPTSQAAHRGRAQRGKESVHVLGYPYAPQPVTQLATEPLKHRAIADLFTMDNFLNPVPKFEQGFIRLRMFLGGPCCGYHLE